MTETITINERFCGPPGSGNGGYVAGRLAALIDGPAEITLRHPCPMDKALQVHADADGFRLLDGETLIAEARPAAVQLETPKAPSLAQAEAAESRYRGLEAHPFDRCFVCGPGRDVGDGLRLFTGDVDGQDMVAARWQVHDRMLDDQGKVRLEYVWAALDCPGYFAVSQTDEPALLGRISGDIGAAQAPFDDWIVVGWPLGRDGRKMFAGTAVFDGSGTCLARAKSIWIKIGT